MEIEVNYSVLGDSQAEVPHPPRDRPEMDGLLDLWENLLPDMLQGLECVALKIYSLEAL